MKFDQFTLSATPAGTVFIVGYSADGSDNLRFTAASLPISTATQTALDLKLSTATAASSYQPLDADLTAIAALTTTSFGRSTLTLADADDLRTLGELGTAATRDVGQLIGNLLELDENGRAVLGNDTIYGTLAFSYYNSASTSQDLALLTMAESAVTVTSDQSFFTAYTLAKTSDLAAYVPTAGTLALAGFSSITGTLGVANGGTGQTTLTSGAILTGNGTGGVTSITPGTGVAPALAVAAGGAGGVLLNYATPPLKIGEWLFNEGAGPLTINQVGGYPSANMFIQGNDLTLAGWTYTVGSTRTARYSADPAGGTQGTRVEIGAGGAYGAGVGQTVTLAAKAYTMSCWVRSNTGSAQTITAYIHNGTTVADFTVPATGWVRYSNTFTSTAGAKILGPVWRSSTGAALDISVWGAQLELGSAVSMSRDNGNLALAGGATWDSTGVNFNGAGRWATAIIPSVNVATISMYCVAKWPAANAALNAVWQGLFGNYTEPYWISAYTDSKGPGVGTGSSGAGANLLVMKKDQLKDDLWHTLTLTYDGTTLKLYIDGDMVQSTTVAISATAITAMGAGSLQPSGGFPFPGTIAYGSIYGTAHTPTQIRTECSRIAAILSPRGITTDPRTSYLIFDGTSITAGTGASATTTAWTAVASAALGNPFGINIGTGSAFVSTLEGRAALVDAQAGAGRKRIYVADVGTNDIALNNTPAATTFTALKSLCLARIAAGFKVLVCTQISRTGTFGGAGGGSMDAQIQAYNALIRADTSFYDGLMDFAGNVNLGATGAYANATYFNVDGIHPNDAGHSLIGGIAATAISTVLAAP